MTSGAHAYHDVLPGFDERQLLKDGCAVCEERGRDVYNALAHMDPARFAKAWRRAWLIEINDGDAGRISNAERDLLRVLAMIQVNLSRHGVPLNGSLPGGDEVTLVVVR